MDGVMLSYLLVSIWLLVISHKLTDAQSPLALPSPDPLTGTVQSTSSATGYLPDTGSNWFDRTHGTLSDNVGTPFIPGPGSPLAIYNKPEVLDPFYSKTNVFHHHHHFLIPIHKHVTHVHHHHHHHHIPVAVHHHSYHHTFHHDNHHEVNHHDAYPGNLVTLVHPTHHSNSHHDSKDILDSVDVTDISKALEEDGSNKHAGNPNTAIEIDFDSNGKVKTYLNHDYHKDSHNSHHTTHRPSHKEHGMTSLDLDIDIPTEIKETKPVGHHQTMTHEVDPSIADSIDFAQLHAIHTQPDASHPYQPALTQPPEPGNVLPGPLAEQTGYGFPQPAVNQAQKGLAGPFASSVTLNQPGGYNTPTGVTGDSMGQANVLSAHIITQNGYGAGYPAYPGSISVNNVPHNGYSLASNYLAESSTQGLQRNGLENAGVGNSNSVAAFNQAENTGITNSNNHGTPPTELSSEAGHIDTPSPVRTDIHIQNTALHPSEEIHTGTDEEFVTNSGPVSDMHQSGEINGVNSGNNGISAEHHIAPEVKDNTIHRYISNSNLDEHHTEMNGIGSDLNENLQDTNRSPHEIHLSEGDHQFDVAATSHETDEHDSSHVKTEHTVADEHPYAIHVSDNGHGYTVNTGTYHGDNNNNNAHQGDFANHDEINEGHHEIHVQEIHDPLHHDESHGEMHVEETHDPGFHVNLHDDDSEFHDGVQHVHSEGHVDVINHHVADELHSPHYGSFDNDANNVEEVHHMDDGHHFDNAHHVDVVHHTDEGDHLDDGHDGSHLEEVHHVDDGHHFDNVHHVDVVHHTDEGDHLDGGHHLDYGHHLDDGNHLEEVHHVDDGHHFDNVHHVDVVQHTDEGHHLDGGSHLEDVHHVETVHQIDGGHPYEEVHHVDGSSFGHEIDLDQLESHLDHGDVPLEEGHFEHFHEDHVVPLEHVHDEHHVNVDHIQEEPHVAVEHFHEEPHASVEHAHEEPHVSVEHVHEEAHVSLENVHDEPYLHHHEHHESIPQLQSDIAHELHETNVHTNVVPEMPGELHDGTHSESIAPEIRESNVHSNVVPEMPGQLHQLSDLEREEIAPELKESNAHSNVLPELHEDHSVSFKPHTDESPLHGFDEHGKEFFLGNVEHNHEDPAVKTELAAPHPGGHEDENNVHLDEKDEELMKKARQNEIVDPPFLRHNDMHGDGYGEGVVPGPDINVGGGGLGAAAGGAPGLPSPVSVSHAEIIPDTAPFLTNHPAHALLTSSVHGRKRQSFSKPNVKNNKVWPGMVSLGKPKRPPSSEETLTKKVTTSRNNRIKGAAVTKAKVKTFFMKPKSAKFMLGNRRENLSYILVDKPELQKKNQSTITSSTAFETIPNEPKELFSTVPNEEKKNETQQGKEEPSENNKEKDFNNMNSLSNNDSKDSKTFEKDGKSIKENKETENANEEYGKNNKQNDDGKNEKSNANDAVEKKEDGNKTEDKTENNTADNESFSQNITVNKQFLVSDKEISSADSNKIEDSEFVTPFENSSNEKGNENAENEKDKNDVGNNQEQKESTELKKDEESNNNNNKEMDKVKNGKETENSEARNAPTKDEEVDTKKEENDEKKKKEDEEQNKKDAEEKKKQEEEYEKHKEKIEKKKKEEEEQKKKEAEESKKQEEEEKKKMEAAEKKKKEEEEGKKREEEEKKKKEEEERKKKEEEEKNKKEEAERKKKEEKEKKKIEEEQKKREEDEKKKREEEEKKKKREGDKMKKEEEERKKKEEEEKKKIEEEQKKREEDEKKKREEEEKKKKEEVENKKKEEEEKKKKEEEEKKRKEAEEKKKKDEEDLKKKKEEEEKKKREAAEKKKKEESQKKKEDEAKKKKEEQQKKQEVKEAIKKQEEAEEAAKKKEEEEEEKARRKQQEEEEEAKQKEKEKEEEVKKSEKEEQAEKDQKKEASEEKAGIDNDDNKSYSEETVNGGNKNSLKSQEKRKERDEKSGFEKVGPQDDDLSNEFVENDVKSSQNGDVKSDNPNEESDFNKNVENNEKSNYAVDTEEWSSSKTQGNNATIDSEEAQTSKSENGNNDEKQTQENLLDQAESLLSPTDTPTHLYVGNTAASPSKSSDANKEAGDAIDEAISNLNTDSNNAGINDAYSPEKAVGDITHALDDDKDVNTVNQYSSSHNNQTITGLETEDRAISSDNAKSSSIELGDNDEENLFGNANENAQILKGQKDKVSYFENSPNQGTQRGERRTIESTQPRLHDDGDLILKRDRPYRHGAKRKLGKGHLRKLKKMNKKSEKIKKRNLVNRIKNSKSSKHKINRFKSKRTFSLRKLVRRYVQ